MENNKIDLTIQSLNRIRTSLDQSLALLSQYGTVTINKYDYYDDFDRLYKLLYSLKNENENKEVNS